MEELITLKKSKTDNNVYYDNSGYVFRRSPMKRIVPLMETSGDEDDKEDRVDQQPQQDLQQQLQQKLQHQQQQGDYQNNDQQTMSTIITGAEKYMSQSAKRKRGQRSPKLITKPVATSTSNRFGILKTQNLSKESDKEKRDPNSEKPTPFYIRGEQNTLNLRNWMLELDVKNYDLKIIRQGQEAKVQLDTIETYRKVQRFLTDKKIPYYTYQLKSARSIKAVMKGIDSRIDPEEILAELKKINFCPRNVINIRNKKNENTSMFMIELEPPSKKLNGHHPIFDLKRFMHMVITMEAPKRNSAPKQCYNCQEYGHTKNMCKLQAICVICAQKHETKLCDKDKNDATVKKCNNCGENHTANWKGCLVYINFAERMKPKQRAEQRIAKNQLKNNNKDMISSAKVIEGSSYASVTAQSSSILKGNETTMESSDLIKLIFVMQTNMSAMQNNISEMIKKQNTMEASINAMSMILTKMNQAK